MDHAFDLFFDYALSQSTEADQLLFVRSYSTTFFEYTNSAVKRVVKGHLQRRGTGGRV